jgi:hypothetical protein
MKATLYTLTQLYPDRWYWLLDAIEGEKVVIGGGYDYTNARAAKRAGRRWAKEHNIEIVEEGE